MDIDINGEITGPTPQDLALQEIAQRARKRIEEAVGFRLSLVTIDLEGTGFRLFHLPSSRPVMIENAEKAAQLIFMEFQEEIYANLNS